MDADLGGTEMLSALQAVFALDAHESRGTGGHRSGADVFVLTDGEVWATDEIVAAARAANQRVFVVGIGSAPAEATVRGLGAATGGAAEFVAPNEDAEAAILRMFARIRAPPRPARRHRLAGVVRLDHAAADRTFRRRDDPRLRRVRRGAVRRRATGPPCEDRRGAAGRDSPTSPAGIDADRTLARMAASRRIAFATPEDALKLALDYGLLTDRTNLIVVHERAAGEKATDLPQLAQVAQMHAAGWGGVGRVSAKLDQPAVLHRRVLSASFAALSDLDSFMHPDSVAGHEHPGVSQPAPDAGERAKAVADPSRSMDYRTFDDASTGLMALEAFFVALLARVPDNLPSSLRNSYG